MTAMLFLLAGLALGFVLGVVGARLRGVDTCPHRHCMSGKYGADLEAFHTKHLRDLAECSALIKRAVDLAETAIIDVAKAVRPGMN